MCTPCAPSSTDNANMADTYYGGRAVHQWYQQQASPTEAIHLSPISSAADWVASGPLRSLHACLATPTSTPPQPTVHLGPTTTPPSQPTTPFQQPHGPAATTPFQPLPGPTPTTPSQPGLQPGPVPSIVLSGPPGPLAAALSATMPPQVLARFLAYLANQQAIVDGGGGSSNTGLAGLQPGGSSTTGLVGQQPSGSTWWASSLVAAAPQAWRLSQHITREQSKLAEQLLIRLATEDGSEGDRPAAEALSQLATWQQSDVVLFSRTSMSAVYFAPQLTTDPVRWWQQHGHFAPELQTVAQRVLCIPATAAANERVFSAFSHVWSDKRASLNPRTHVDVMYLRPEEYRERWDERDDMLRARHLEMLMLGKTDGYWEQLRYGFLERAAAPAKDAAPTGITAPGTASVKGLPSLIAVGESKAVDHSMAIPTQTASLPNKPYRWSWPLW
ncbi:hypothetical protein QJQ45_029169 [Haematococcus lacustris]|nr:hypothetical protein QJQ45_029169 [Haematococcus lacustris]